MSSYSQAIGIQGRVRRSEASVSSLAALFVPSLGAVIFAVALVHVLFLSQGTTTLFRDSDTGWHIRNGEAILNTATVPRADTFSYTAPGTSWFAWEWLSDALLASAHRLAGPTGVAFLTAITIALIAWAGAHLALSLGGNLFLTATAAVLMLSTTSIHWLARPHIFSWLIALLFLAIAERERRTPSSSLYWLPELACLWANLHASFLLGPAILFLYAIGEFIRAATVSERPPHPEHVTGNHSLPVAARIGISQWPPSRRFAAASLASLAATFINPYGWHLHGHVFQYLQNTYLMDHISEFRSFNFHAPGSVYVEIFLVTAVLGGLAMLRQRAYGPALLTAALLHLSMYSARHLPTAAVLLLPLCVVALTREADRYPKLHPLLDYSERLASIDRRVCGVVPVVVVLAAALAALVPVAHAGRAGFDPASFPVRAADFLERRGLENRVFAKDQWGGYLIYRFDGHMKVFLDGRSDLYGQELLETYAQVMDVKPAWNTVLKQYDVRFVMVPPEHALASVLTLSSDWKRVYTDSVATIFERIG